MLASDEFIIESGLLLWPTPAGAYYAVHSSKKDDASRYILQLLAQDQTPVLDAKQLQLLDEDEQLALNKLYHLQNMGHLQVIDAPVINYKQPLQEILPSLLEQLCDDGKAVLADEQGLSLSQIGFAHESAEELSALSASLHVMQERHRKLLQNNLSVYSSAWGVIDAAGNSQVGFWPLYLPAGKFTLILSGMPRFNSASFVSILACLAMRYHS